MVGGSIRDVTRLPPSPLTPRALPAGTTTWGGWGAAQREVGNVFGLPIYGGGPWSEAGALSEHKALAPGAKVEANAEAGVVDRGAVDALAGALSQADLDDAHSSLSSSLQSTGPVPPAADTAFAPGPQRWASNSVGGTWGGGSPPRAHQQGDKRFFSLPEMGGAVGPPSRQLGSGPVPTPSPWALGAMSTDPQPSHATSPAPGRSASHEQQQAAWHDSPEGEPAHDPPGGGTPPLAQAEPGPQYSSAAEALAAAQGAAARNDQATLMQALKALEALSGVAGAKGAEPAGAAAGYMPGYAPIGQPAPYGPMPGMGAMPHPFPAMAMPRMPVQPMPMTTSRRPSLYAAGPRASDLAGAWPGGYGEGQPMHMAHGMQGWMPYPVLDLPLSLTLESSRYVCLTGVPAQRTEEDVRRLLEAFGPLRWVWDRWARCGFYFAAFYDLRHAEVAAGTLAVRPHPPCVPSPCVTPSHVASGAQNAAWDHHPIRCRLCVPVTEACDLSWNDGILIVFNVPNSVDLDGLRAAFERFGDVLGVRKASSASSNRFVEYFDSACARVPCRQGPPLTRCPLPVRTAERAARGLHRTPLQPGTEPIDVKVSRPHAALRQLLERMKGFLSQLEARRAAIMAASQPPRPAPHPSYQGAGVQAYGPPPPQSAAPAAPAGAAGAGNQPAGAVRSLAASAVHARPFAPRAAGAAGAATRDQRP